MKHPQITSLLAAIALLGAGCQTTTQTSVQTAPASAPAQEQPSGPPPAPSQEQGDEARMRPQAETGAKMEAGAEADLRVGNMADLKADADVKVDAGMQAKANVVTVLIQGFKYVPATIKVKKGDKVVFTNMDSVRHTVTSEGNASFDSKLFGKDESYTLDTSTLGMGENPFYCIPHPMMKGSVIVE